MSFLGDFLVGPASLERVFSSDSLRDEPAYVGEIKYEDKRGLILVLREVLVYDSNSGEFFNGRRECVAFSRN